MKRAAFRQPFSIEKTACLLIQYTGHNNYATQKQSIPHGYQVISYISTHFQEPLTLDKIAQELHFNKFYISRVFTGRLHCTFHEYLNRLRLDYAARLLRETDRSIMEIWQEAGFESQKTFNRTFRSCYHMTPSEYRRGA